MNYLSVYNNLISKRKTNPLPKGVYGEDHHIIPKCMDGTDDKDNIIKLTAKEHYIAHALLFKHYRTSALAHAWHSMLRKGRGQQRYFTAAQYDMAKKARSKILSETMKGEGNPFFGKQHTEEAKAINRQKAYDRMVDLTPELIEEWVIRIGARDPKSEEHKKKIGRKGLIMLQNKYTLEIIRDYPDNYDLEVWINPKKITPEKKHKCEYCDVVTTKGNLKRWHNDNCKHKPKV